VLADEQIGLLPCVEFGHLLAPFAPYRAYMIFDLVKNDTCGLAVHFRHAPVDLYPFASGLGLLKAKYLAKLDPRRRRRPQHRQFGNADGLRGRFGAVPLRNLCERHRRSWLGFHPRRRLLAAEGARHGASTSFR